LTEPAQQDKVQLPEEAWENAMTMTKLKMKIKTREAFLEEPLVLASEEEEEVREEVREKVWE
jgi:hypothetical protein